MVDKEVRQERYDIELPQSIIESFARFLVPEIRKYYDSEQQGSRHQALTLAFLLLTLQPHHDSKAAFEIIGVRVMSIWWRRGESNPRPKAT